MYVFLERLYLQPYNQLNGTTAYLGTIYHLSSASMSMDVYKTGFAKDTLLPNRHAL
jgi:hypothetical protein